MPHVPGHIADIRARRTMAQAVAGRRPRRSRRVPRQNFPSGERLRYQRALTALVATVAEQIEEAVSGMLPRLADEIRNRNPERRDAPADEIAVAFEALENRLRTPELRRAIRLATETMTAGVNNANVIELNRMFEATIGVGLPPSEPFLQDTLAAANRENVRRITGLLAQQVEQAEATILAGFRRGLRHEAIAEQLRERTGVSTRRARLIARDQVASLNGELSRQRQTNLGVTHFFWRTSQDERVRDEHADLEGRRFSFAEGAPGEGLPGEPINCRCTAEPDLSDILAAV